MKIHHNYHATMQLDGNIFAKNNFVRFSKPVSQVEDDGFSISNGRMTRFWKFLSSKFLARKPGSLILVRHGESEWNFNKTFTGWVDVDLSELGVREIEHAGRLLLAGGYSVDVVYTSRLKRAIRSTWILLGELHQKYRQVFKSWRLNERMYGALEGLSKPGTAKELGEDVVQQWRAGLYARPPPMSENHPFWHKNERKYADLDPKDIPVTESLQDTMERTLPLWNNRILPDLKLGKNVMIVAHANSLRGIVKHIDNLSDKDIVGVGIPNGIPLVYKFDKSMRPVQQERAVRPLSGEFLEKKGLLRAALAKEEELAMRVPGFTIDEQSTRASTMNPWLRSLSILNLEHQLVDLVDLASKQNLSSSDQIYSNSHTGMLSPTLTDRSGGLLSPSPSSLSPPPASILTNPVSSDTELSGLVTNEKAIDSKIYQEELSKPVVVIIRHGKTEYNKLGLFTGWEDAPLAAEGREEALAAGRTLKAHGIEFDVVYTSWLSRAIETAWIIMNELDSVWLPIIKSWRLNERMYGALTGMSKSMIAQIHGEDKYLQWRFGYQFPPPKISSFSPAYPGNDERYVNNVDDIGISVFESVIRSLAHGRLEIHRNFPKTESLSDCMKRTIPYYERVIRPGSVDQGKNVLIASSKNAIRGLLMHLCEIPEDRIHEVEIPTGVPLVYDVRTKRIRLLDDGLYGNGDPAERYNFGKASNYLFQPHPNLNSSDVIRGGNRGPLIRLRRNMDLLMKGDSLPSRAELVV